LRQRGWPVDYRRLGESADRDLCALLAARLERDRPARLVLVEPGEWRLEQGVRAACERLGVALDLRDDLHFMISRAGFAEWAKKYRQPRMEFFY
ncbi:cryptochrome/photolyase family protein, partial [Escherichia coli]|nr:cryptochrome/photolyase family protein [Escherichia coli]